MKKSFFTITLFCFSIIAIAQLPVTTPGKTKKEANVIQNTAIKTLPVNYDFSKIKICVDRKPAANISLPPRRATAGSPVPKINSDGSISQVGVIQQGLTGATEKMWNPGDVITVYLDPNNGSDLIRDKVKTYAREWERTANIKFDFVTDFNAAKIKVGFFHTKQSWSWVGRDVLVNPLKEYTMNFGWFESNTTGEEFSRVITHEFGHALGFLHEHQSPASPLQFDLPKLYKFFKETNNWDPAMVDDQIVRKYSQSNTNFSGYDPNSIMHYMIPQDLLVNGTGSLYENSWLSGIDMQYARAWYPFPPKGVNTNGNLRTNDDCDDVAFKVEYDAVPAGMVEFTLQLGEANSKKVTWWKQVGIPRTNNTETFLWVQNISLIKEENRSTVTIQIPITEIAANKGISFWKGKALGIHTPLAFKWNVLPAITGGCRVTLLWNKDTCM